MSDIPQMMQVALPSLFEPVPSVTARTAQRCPGWVGPFPGLAVVSILQVFLVQEKTLQQDHELPSPCGVGVAVGLWRGLVPSHLQKGPRTLFPLSQPPGFDVYNQP